MDKMQALADSIAMSTYVNMVMVLICLLTVGFITWALREIRISNKEVLDELTALCYMQNGRPSQDNKSQAVRG